MNILKRFNKQPQEAKQSIYDFIVANIDTATGMLQDSSMPLPDDANTEDGNRLRWVAGGLDGALGHHASPQSEEESQKQIWQKFMHYVKLPAPAEREALYQSLIQGHALANVDNLLRQIRANREQIDINPVYQLSMWLMRNSTHSNGCKFGIAIAGLLSSASKSDEVLTLGKHDEFSLYAAVAICNNSEDPNADLWQLAKCVQGWGRIQLVERIKSVTDPELQKWLVLEGFRNNVMYEYLAYHCAVEGDLLGQLKSKSVDDPLITSASDIISALIIGGPAESIQDYQPAIELLKIYLNLVVEKDTDLQVLISANQILALANGVESFRRLAKADEASRMEIQKLASTIVNSSKWQALITQQLHSTDHASFYLAETAARIKDIDTWDYHYAKLQKDPLDSTTWYHLATKVNAERIDGLIEFAQQNLDIASIATGPADSMGFGAEFKVHHCIDFLLPALNNFPGKGVSIIRAALLSPVVRNRNIALNVLEVWGSDHITSDLVTDLKKLEQLEVNDQTNQSLQQLLAGLN
jgi:hypothetical protein